MTKIFEGKTALITGAAGGIGFSVVNKLATNGATVVLADIDKEVLSSCTEFLDDLQSTYHLLPGDLNDSDYCNNLPIKQKH